MPDILHTIVAFLVVLTVVVFVHELGHFLVARWNKVKVEVFSIGMGPEIMGFTDRQGTRWRLSLFPVGGYVRFFGDKDEASGPDDADHLEAMTPEEKAVCFHHKPVGARSAVVAAGPLANFAFSILIFALLFMTHGQVRSVPVIDTLIAGGAAEAAGLQVGDRIEAINGERIARFQDVQRLVALSGGETLDIDVRRNEAPVAVTVTPRIVQADDGLGNQIPMPQIGVQIALSPADVHRLGPVDALAQAVRQTWTLSADTLTYIGQMVTGHRSADELGGPIRIALFSAKAAERGVADLVMFIALLSANLGLINLFPIPMLDGGHLMFYTIEALRGRPLAERFQEVGFRIGLAMVLALMAFATWNDLALKSWWG
ncbi:RIP metalloprotease RseP [Pararhodospirillum oryzae]|uniref:Zinc metalloprotease n=1 Tax=Pararhodospirillum oryzae TaxID=478448 RepID=A0A512H8H1_9PROT|nr:RIP metalloprotease RseP [Pararhodospirillum oryzae]GEO81753.1 zinc metalloprotease [Pararhodospirillum oryzae]